MHIITCIYFPAGSESDRLRMRELGISGAGVASYHASRNGVQPIVSNKTSIHHFKAHSGHLFQHCPDNNRQ